MKWRIVVQILGLLTNWAFAAVLRDLKHHGDRYDLRQIRSVHDTRYDKPVEARRPRYSLAGYTMLGAQIGLLVASLISRSKARRSVLTILSLVSVVPSEVMVNVLMPELYRSDERRRRNVYLRPWGKKPNITDIGDAPSRRVA